MVMITGIGLGRTWFMSVARAQGSGYSRVFWGSSVSIGTGPRNGQTVCCFQPGIHQASYSVSSVCNF